ncbi:hypothetical protein IE81DRAFT_344232 [Ceraceosorus guamensis]|uniref:Uncharacterized protein n=1 Tax=Ceraceosorus guamensis TaxID=1522189 RepID=A0A316W8F7_9BASI|nr:hypothetical protein IE81DRAFT_344232 [Ceraceosorus guamensis]PWN46177.1 hypothetical protein IE81DRAFT_344232 [Ceraceosorus guamensis]
MGSSSSKPARKLADTAQSAVRSSGGSSRAGLPPNASPSPSANAKPSASRSSHPSSDADASSASASAFNISRASPSLTSDPSKAARPTAGPRDGAAGLNQKFSESKTDAIREDARDPHLIANLASLGPAKVKRNRLTYRPNDQMLGILQARQKREQQEAQSATDSTSNSGVAGAQNSSNHMSANSISTLLDARKSCRSAEDVRALAHGYNIDVQVLENLARWVTSPSVVPRPTKKVHEGDDETPLADAVWTEPALSIGALERPKT